MSGKTRVENTQNKKTGVKRYLQHRMERFLRSIRLALLDADRLGRCFQLNAVEVQMEGAHLFQTTGCRSHEGGRRALQLGMARDLEVVLLLAHERIVGRGEIEALVGVHAIVRSWSLVGKEEGYNLNIYIYCRFALTNPVGPGRKAYASSAAGTERSECTAWRTCHPNRSCAWTTRHPHCWRRWPDYRFSVVWTGWYWHGRAAG